MGSLFPLRARSYFRSETRDLIARRIATEARLRLCDLYGSNVTQRVSHARQRAYYEMALAGHTASAIARHFERHHTTVLYGVKAHLNRTTDSVVPCVRWPTREGPPMGDRFSP